MSKLMMEIRPVLTAEGLSAARGILSSLSRLLGESDPVKRKVRVWDSPGFYVAAKETLASFEAMLKAMDPAEENPAVKVCETCSHLRKHREGWTCELLGWRTLYFTEGEDEPRRAARMYCDEWVEKGAG